MKTMLYVHVENVHMENINMATYYFSLIIQKTN